MDPCLAFYLCLLTSPFVFSFASHSEEEEPVKISIGVTSLHPSNRKSSFSKYHPSRESESTKKTSGIVGEATETDNSKDAQPRKGDEQEDGGRPQGGGDHQSGGGYPGGDFGGEARYGEGGNAHEDYGPEGAFGDDGYGAFGRDEDVGQIMPGMYGDYTAFPGHVNALMHRNSFAEHPGPIDASLFEEDPKVSQEIEPKQPDEKEQSQPQYEKEDIQPKHSRDYKKQYDGNEEKEPNNDNALAKDVTMHYSHKIFHDLGPAQKEYTPIYRPTGKDYNEKERDNGSSQKEDDRRRNEQDQEDDGSSGFRDLAPIRRDERPPERSEDHFRHRSSEEPAQHRHDEPELSREDNRRENSRDRAVEDRDDRRPASDSRSGKFRAPLLGHSGGPNRLRVRLLHRLLHHGGTAVLEPSPLHES